MKLTVCSMNKSGVYHLVCENNRVYQMSISATPVPLNIGDVVYSTDPEQDGHGYLWVNFEYFYEQKPVAVEA